MIKLSMVARIEEVFPLKSYNIDHPTKGPTLFEVITLRVETYNEYNKAPISWYIKATNHTAKNISENLRRNDVVWFDGRLQFENIKDKNGNSRWEKAIYITNYNVIESTREPEAIEEPIPTRTLNIDEVFSDKEQVLELEEW